MKIGITTVTGQDLNVWSSGIVQNVVFLAEALRRIDFVEEVCLIDAGDAGTLGPQVDLHQLGLKLVPMREAGDLVDVVIEVAGILPVTLARLLRARGKKLVNHCVAQPYTHLLEITVFDRPGSFQPPDRYDRVWLLPKDERFVPMMRTLHRCPALVAPYLWDPGFLKARMADIRKAGLQFGSGALGAAKGRGQHGWRVAVFEPNISPIKTCIIPMLVADVAARIDPAAVDYLFVLNAEHLVQHATMLHLGRSMDLVRNQKATFVGRHDVAGFLADQKIDAVISHQIGNDQNYLYLDVLYGGYPLIHNSPWLAGHGYYYPDNDVQQGAEQLLRARAQHAAGSGHRPRDADRPLFESVSPGAEANVRAYAGLLRELTGDAA